MLHRLLSFILSSLCCNCVLSNKTWRRETHLMSRITIVAIVLLLTDTWEIQLFLIRCLQQDTRYSWVIQPTTSWAVRLRVAWLAWCWARGMYRPEPCRYSTIDWRRVPGAGISSENPSGIAVSVTVRFTLEAANYSRSDCDPLLHLADKRMCCDEKMNARLQFPRWIIIALHILILGADKNGEKKVMCVCLCSIWCTVVITCDNRTPNLQRTPSSIDMKAINTQLTMCPCRHQGLEQCKTQYIFQSKKEGKAGCMNQSSNRQKNTPSHIFCSQSPHWRISGKQKEKWDGCWISDCDDGVADKHQRRWNKCYCDTNYRSPAVLLWAPTVHSIVQATQNNTAPLARSSTCEQKKMKMLLCDCSRGWRNGSAVIKSACKCIQASRRHIDFSISDWLSPSILPPSPLFFWEQCEMLALEWWGWA